MKNETRRGCFILILLLLAGAIAFLMVGCLIAYSFRNDTALALCLLGTVILSLVEGLLVMYMSLISTTKTEVLKFLKLDDEEKINED